MGGEEDTGRRPAVQERRLLGLPVRWILVTWARAAPLPCCMADPTEGEPAQLLGQMAWVRRLAQALARDEHVGDDVAQQVAGEWLDGHPVWARGSGLRGWLAARVRRRTTDHFRRERAAQRRAAGAVGRDAAEATDEVVLRLERQRLVAAAVHALAEPFRTAVLLHHLDGLSTCAIAARTGVTEDAVRKRLERGRAALRRRLAATFGAPAVVWCGWLDAPPAALPAAAGMGVLATGGATLMLGKVLLGAAIAIAAVLVWWAPWADVEPSLMAAGGHGVVVAAQAQPVARDVVRAADERVLAPAPVPEPASGGRGAAMAFAVGGRVFVGDVPGCPPGLRIEVDRANEDMARTAHGGDTWQLAAATPGPWTLWVTSETTSPAQIPLPVLPLAAGATFDLHLQAGRELVLRFVDAQGAPLADLPFACTIHLELHRGLGRVYSRAAQRGSTTDGGGLAVVAGLPERGSIEVATDTQVRERRMQLRNGPPMIAHTTGGPVWSLALTADLPRRLEATIVTARPLGEAFAAGRIPAWARAGGAEVRVVAYEVTADGDRRIDRFLPEVDADGAFTLRGGAPSRYRVWLEGAGNAKVSDVVDVAFASAGAQPEIVFTPTQRATARLRFVHVPVEGHVAVRGGAAATSFACAGAVREVELAVGPEEEVQVALAADVGSKTAWQRLVPAALWRAGPVEVDLAGAFRTLRVDAGDLALPGELALGLWPVAAKVDLQNRVTAFVAAGNQAAGARVFLPAGRWLFAIPREGASPLLGRIDVAEGDEQVWLRPRTQRVPAAGLRPAVRLDSLAGVSLEELPPGLRTVQVDAGAIDVELPEGAAWGVVHRDH